MKLTKDNVGKRFRWSRYYPGDKDGKPAIRLTCSVDGCHAKVTQCRDLTPEEISDAAKWMIEVSCSLKNIRNDAVARTNPKPKRKKKAA